MAVVRAAAVMAAVVRVVERSVTLVTPVCVMREEQLTGLDC